ncbi:beta-1,3-glucosyltransferase [Octopus bimaculoides]|nr:beta-1,3-glucosyltransferase [Octopus bimaculoides]
MILLQLMSVLTCLLILLSSLRQAEVLADPQTSNGTENLALKDIVFVILTQDTTFHSERAKQFKKDFYNQLKAVSKNEKPKLFFTHKKWPITGAWTIFPLLSDFVENFSNNSWIFISEEEVRLDLFKLLDVLKQYDSSKPLFLGNALQDESPVIIHHFAFAENPSQFSYPNMALGFLMSMPLVKSLHYRWPPSNMRTDFSIDLKHELAMYIWDDGNGVALTDVPEFCNRKQDCVTYLPLKFPQCGAPISSNDLFVAVKTCQKFHKERIPIVKSTWLREAKHVELYSDVEDLSIPTISLGVRNTERGHCKKTYNILIRALREPSISSKPWLLIVDDDTIISITRLRKMLACYNPAEALAIGERYGYGVTTGSGYNYITGGGGMVFSRAAVQFMVSSNLCSCPRDDSPDDMILGICLQNLNIPVIHSSLFHQARPNDYNKELLELQDPISFHKHWMIDPKKVYEEWFLSAAQFHDEL